MNYYAGIDVSLEESCVCVIDAAGKIVREAKVRSEPEALIAWFRSLGVEVTRIGLDAGPLSQWLYAGMQQAGPAVELLVFLSTFLKGRSGFPQQMGMRERRESPGASP
jgi:transposase